MRKSGYCGVRGGIWWRTGEMNLLMAVFCSHCFFYLAPGFHFYSPDVDECANPRSCPEHSTCHNSLGSYSCVCNPGFQSRSGRKSFQGRGEMCEGICRGLLGNPVQCACKDRNGGEKLRWVSGEFKALICKAEANSNWFNKHFLSTYCMPSIILGIEVTVITQKKNIYSTGTSYHGERIRQQTKYSHVFGLCAIWLSLRLMAWHSSMQWQLCWLTRGYWIHVERGSLTRWKWCWLLAGGSARVVSCRSKFFSMLLVHCSHDWLFVTPWLQPPRILCPWHFPSKSTRVGFHCLLNESCLFSWLVELPNTMAAESSMGISREPGGSVWYCDDLAWYFYDLVSPPPQSHAWSDSRGGHISLIG